jgi:hypothetical protein
MPKKELLVFSAIVLMGFLDWLTTMTGVLFFGATEVNPLLAGLTKSSMVLFSAVKISAVVIAGFTFYKLTAFSRPTTNDWHFTSRFLDGGYSLTFLALTAVVANNMITLIRL